MQGGIFSSVGMVLVDWPVRTLDYRDITLSSIMLFLEGPESQYINSVPEYSTQKLALGAQLDIVSAVQRMVVVMMI